MQKLSQQLLRAMQQLLHHTCNLQSPAAATAMTLSPKAPLQGCAVIPVFLGPLMGPLPALSRLLNGA